MLLCTILHITLLQRQQKIAFKFLKFVSVLGPILFMKSRVSPACFVLFWIKTYFVLFSCIMCFVHGADVEIFRRITTVCDKVHSLFFPFFFFFFYNNKPNKQVSESWVMFDICPCKQTLLYLCYKYPVVQWINSCPRDVTVTYIRIVKCVPLLESKRKHVYGWRDAAAKDQMNA